MKVRASERNVNLFTILLRAKPKFDEVKDESSLPNGINFPLSSLNFQLETIAKRLIESLCGTTTPPEGTRNTTLYEAAKQMAYLDGITEEELIEAFRPLAFLGLPETEARSCIRSAMKREKTWLYTLPPELSRAMEQTHPIPPCEGGGTGIAIFVYLFVNLILVFRG